MNYATIQEIAPFPDPTDTLVWQQTGSSTYPTYNVAIGHLVRGSDGVPSSGTPGHSDYVPEIKAVPDSFFAHRNFDPVVLTKAEWDGWHSSYNDDDYVKSIIVSRLKDSGVVLA